MHTQVTKLPIGIPTDKPTLIEEIRKRNRSATREFLSAFSAAELAQYLASLQQIAPEPTFTAPGAYDRAMP
jgi:hypothetical protein